MWPGLPPLPFLPPLPLPLPPRLPALPCALLPPCLCLLLSLPPFSSPLHPSLPTSFQLAPPPLPLLPHLVPETEGHDPGGSGGGPGRPLPALAPAGRPVYSGGRGRGWGSAAQLGREVGQRAQRRGAWSGPRVPRPPQPREQRQDAGYAGVPFLPPTAGSGWRQPGPAPRDQGSGDVWGAGARGALAPPATPTVLPGLVWAAPSSRRSSLPPSVSPRPLQPRPPSVHVADILAGHLPRRRRPPRSSEARA